MIRTRIEVRNMACEMCEAHVIEAVRKILSHGEARRIRASHRRNEVTIESEAPLPESLVCGMHQVHRRDGLSHGRRLLRRGEAGPARPTLRLSPPSPSLAAIRQGFPDVRRESREIFRGNHFCFTADVTKPLQ